MKSIILHILWLVLWLIANCGKLSAQVVDTISLDLIIEQSRQRSLPGYEAQRDIEQARLRFKSYQADFLPQLQFQGTVPNFTRSFNETTQPDGTIDFNSIRYNNSSLSLQVSQDLAATGTRFFIQSDLQRYDDFELDIRRYNGVPMRIGILQQLSAYNSLNWAKKLEPVRLNEAQKQFVYDVEAISIEAVGIYFDLLVAQIDLQIALNNRDINEQLFNIAKERFELGKISENDLLQLQLERIRADQDANGARQALDLAATVLSNYLGESDSMEVYLRTPEIAVFPQISEKKALEAARRNRPELESFVRRRLEAKENIARAKADFGFQASLRATFGFARSSEEFSDIYNDPQEEQGLFFQFSLPIVDWGKRKSEVQIQRLQYNYEVEAIDRESIAFDANIRQLVFNYQRLQESMQIATEMRRISQQQYNISRERYLLGDISITDLTLSQRAKDQAQRSYVSTLRQYWRAYYQLRLLTLFDFEQQQDIRYDYSFTSNK